MNNDLFLNALTLMNTSLLNQVMDRTYNSVGSNIFFEFGEQKEIVFQNGKKHFQKEWCIWLSGTSWRISQNNKYVVGSGESLEINIQLYLERLLGKRIESYCFVSHFLDMQINFEDGYQVTTFFNYIEKDQWLVFLPNETEIVLDCSSVELIKSVQNLSKDLKIKRKYKKTNSLFLDLKIEDILFNENEISKMVCSDNISIDLGLSSWRIEDNSQYFMGRKDYYFGCIEGHMKELQEKLLCLVRKKIKHMNVDSSTTDLRLEFEDGFTLEMFTHSKTNPWKICHHDDVILRANI